MAVHSSGFLDDEARHLVVVDDGREHPDRKLYKLFRTVRDAAAKGERIAGRQQVARLAVPLAQSPLQEIDKLDARVLEAREDFALVGERDQKGFEDATRTTLMPPETTSCTTPNRFSSPSGIVKLPALVCR